MNEFEVFNIYYIMLNLIFDEMLFPNTRSFIFTK